MSHASDGRALGFTRARYVLRLPRSDADRSGVLPHLPTVRLRDPGVGGFATWCRLGRHHARGRTTTTQDDHQTSGVKYLGSVPGRRSPNAEAVLSDILVSGARVRAGVAFVTTSGVDLLAEIMQPLDGVELEVTARAGDATEPEALQRLRDELGADVYAVLGEGYRRFHPKLWLIEGDGRLTVLSGSGNLTRGGLVGNEEQFELFEMPADSDAAERQRARFDDLTFRARPLDDLEATYEWAEWMRIRKLRETDPGLRRLRDMEKRLNRYKVVESYVAEKKLLLDDLRDLYARTAAAPLKRADGGKYVPSRFLQGINRAEASGEPVDLVARICRRESDGYDIIAGSGRRDLTVESLVVDASKPYHHLFSEKTIELCRQRLTQFDATATPQGGATVAADAVFIRLQTNLPGIAEASQTLFDLLRPSARQLIANDKSVTLILGDGGKTVRIGFYDGSGSNAGNTADGRGPVYIDWRSFVNDRTPAEHESLAAVLEQFSELAPDLAVARAKGWRSDVGLGPALVDSAGLKALASALVAAAR